MPATRQTERKCGYCRQIGNASGEPLSISGINLAIDKKRPLYLRGYKALEKEIALLDARGTGSPYFHS